MQSAIAASGLFDANYYLLNNPDVAEAGVDPLAHFCAVGWREDRFANPYFHPHWYRRTHCLTPDAPPLEHYLAGGEAAGLRPCRYFDPTWYRRVQRLPDRASPLADYLARRRAQDVAPLPLFDPLFYCGHYRALVRPGRDPFLHYLAVGAARDLRPAAWFDVAGYRARRIGEGDRHGERNPLLHLLSASGGRAWAALRCGATVLFLDTDHVPHIPAAT
jgi:hypothetical protein